MRCALASLGFINGNVMFNKKVIIDAMIKYSNDVDIIIFGEAFLQGFYGATFDVEHDDKMAITQSDPIMKDICSAAREYAVAVSFGFIEKVGDAFYSSQITIDSAGKVIDVYRRVSPGWKEVFANEKYCEGKGFHAFPFMGKRIVVALCGDLWFDENIHEVKRLHPDIIFWPVYTDYNCIKWNETIKHEYAAQAGMVGSKVLYVNSFCIDKDDEEIAKGGAALFINGHIDQEIPSGQENVLIVEV